MPIHPAVAGRLGLLDGIPSFRARYADPAMRARIQRFRAWPDDVPALTTRQEVAPGPHGDVPVRVYTPDGGATRAPGLVWVHGGAFVGGDLDMAEADWTAREVCAATGAVVVSVDYRLARDGVRHPVPHDDVVAAVRYAA